MENYHQPEKIELTANTVFDISQHSNDSHTNNIAVYLATNYPEFLELNISTDNFKALVVARYFNSHRFLELIAQLTNGQLQVVELGAGFTSHFLSIRDQVSKYIEVDYPLNSKIKSKATEQFYNGNKITFVGGDILESTTWEKINSVIDRDKPVVIFSEGVIAPYFNLQQKMVVANYIKPFLAISGSAFLIDDTLKNHPELQKHPVIAEGMARITKKSGNNNYQSNIPHTFENEFDFWQKQLGINARAIQYTRSKPEMDFAISELKSIACINSINNLDLEISNLSDSNAIIRNWK